MLNSFRPFSILSLRSTTCFAQPNPSFIYRPPQPYTIPFNRGFKNNFKPKLGKQAPKKKKTFMVRAKEALFEGLFKGSDFNKMEKFIILREAKTQEEAADDYFNRGKYQKALEGYKIALNLLRKSLEEDDPELAYYMGKIGDVYYEVKEWDLAINSYKDSINVLANNIEGRDEDVARFCFRIGMSYMKGGSYGEAIPYINEAAEYYSDGSNGRREDNVIASCYSILSECYLRYQNYEKALVCIEKLLPVVSKGNKEKRNPLIVQYYLNYGLTLGYVCQDYDRALGYIQEYLETQVEMNGDNSASVGMTYLKMSEVYSLRGQHDEAMNLLGKALEIIQSRGGTSDKRIGMCYLGMARVHGMKKEWKECVEWSRKALGCFEEEEHFEIFECYRNMACAYSGLERQDIAVENLKKCVEIREKVIEGLEEGDPQFMVLNGWLGAVYHNKGEYGEEVKYNEMWLRELCKMIAEGK